MGMIDAALLLLAASQASGASAAPEPQQAEERTAVVAAVDRYLDSFVRGDAPTFRSMLHTEGGSFVIGYGADGKPRVRYMTNAQDAADFKKMAGKVEEKYWDPTVLVHRDMAVFWAPYSFSLDGKRSHCGVNVFNLVRFDGAWKVANSMWTMEPKGCPKE